VDEKREEQIDSTRENLETDRRRFITYREFVYLVIASIVAVFGCMGLWSWRSANVASSSWWASHKEQLDQGVSDFVAAAGNLKDGSGQIKPSLVALTATEQEATGAVGDIRKDSIPEISRELRGLGRIETGLTDTTAELKDAISVFKDKGGDNLDESKKVFRALTAVVNDSNDTINKKIGPEIVTAVKATTTLMGKYGTTADEATGMVKAISEKSGKTVDQINAWIADPRWGKILDNFVTTSEAAALTAKNISKFSKISIIVSILSRAASALIPGLLNRASPPPSSRPWFTWKPILANS
jgi:hypothetical protein